MRRPKLEPSEDRSASVGHKSVESASVDYRGLPVPACRCSNNPMQIVDVQSDPAADWSRLVESERTGGRQVIEEAEFQGEMAAVELAIHKLDVPEVGGVTYDEVIEAGEHIGHVRFMGCGDT